MDESQQKIHENQNQILIGPDVQSIGVPRCRLYILFGHERIRNMLVIDPLLRGEIRL